MNAKHSYLAAALLALTVQSSAIAQTSKPLAKVNGQTISGAVGDVLINEQVSQGAPNNEGLKNAVRDELVRREVIAQEARKKGLDKKTDVQARLDLARQSVLLGAYLEDWVKANPIPEAQLRSTYDEQIKQMGEREYKARHIMVEKEEEAVAVIKKLQSGGKFDDLVKDTRDVGTKDQGGDLGWVRPTQFDQPFADALVKLEKGKFTPQPVRSPAGFHVIMLDDVRKYTPPAYDEVKPRLQQTMQQQAIQKHVEDLLKKAKVE